MYRALDLLAGQNLAGMVYPLGVGTCIAGFALYSLLWLKERANPAIVSGVVLSVVSVGCLVMRAFGW
jgi:multidrug transporter EmrE-like cation transporter